MRTLKLFMYSTICLLFISIYSPGLQASEMESQLDEFGYTQDSITAKTEMPNEKIEDPMTSASTVLDGSVYYNDDVTYVYDNVVHMIAYAVQQDGKWYHPLYMENDTGLLMMGTDLTNSLVMVSEDVEDRDGTTYYTRNFTGHKPVSWDLSGKDATLTTHLDPVTGELIFDATFINNSTSNYGAKFLAELDTCLFESDTPNLRGCDEDEVPLYSQGNKKGMYLNSEAYDINFFVNFIGDTPPVYAEAHDYNYTTNGHNHINTGVGELLLDDVDTEIGALWSDTVAPGESTTFSFSIGLSPGKFVTNEAPVITADDNASTNEETTLTDAQLLTLFDVSAIDDADGDLTSDITVDQSTVDYTTPGTYPVTFSVTDSKAVKTTFESSLEIVDIKPTIGLSTSDVTIDDTETSIDYLKAFGATATEISPGDLNDMITVDSSAVEFGTAGSYDVVFTVSDQEGTQVSATGTLTITSSPEQITANETATSDEEKNLTDQQLIDLFAVTATDPSDGDISSSLVVDQSAVDYSVPGDYSVVFTATNSRGEETSYTSTLTINDLLPTIAAKLSTFTATQGTMSTKQIIAAYGVTATEINDGDLTDIVTNDISSIDINTPGTYTVTFTVSDEEGNSVNLPVELIITANDTVTSDDNSETDVSVPSGNERDDIATDSDSDNDSLVTPSDDNNDRSSEVTSDQEYIKMTDDSNEKLSETGSSTVVVIFGLVTSLGLIVLTKFKINKLS